MKKIPLCDKVKMGDQMEFAMIAKTSPEVSQFVSAKPKSRRSVRQR
jgi:hypothetical protein